MFMSIVESRATTRWNQLGWITNIVFAAVVSTFACATENALHERAGIVGIDRGSGTGLRSRCIPFLRC